MRGGADTVVAAKAAGKMKLLPTLSLNVKTYCIQHCNAINTIHLNL